MKLLLLLFIILPILEILLLIEVGGWIGSLNTLLLIVLTALIGSLMLRQQGLSTLLRARAKLAGGGIPLQEMLEGICLAVGGALLLTPGFITDALGLACLLPASRRWLVGALTARVNWRVIQGSRDERFEIHARRPSHSEAERTPEGRRTIEGEYHHETQGNESADVDKKD